MMRKKEELALFITYLDLHYLLNWHGQAAGIYCTVPTRHDKLKTKSNSRTIKKHHCFTSTGCSHKEYSFFCFPTHFMFTFNVFCGSLVNSIFRNSSSATNNARFSLHSKLSFRSFMAMEILKVH